MLPTIKKTLTLTALCAALHHPAYATTPASNSVLQESRSAISLHRFANDLAAQIVASPDYTSVQYAVIHQNNIVLSGQAGTNDGELTHETVYGIGSVSKMFAAASVMKLAAENKLDLDTPIYSYLPDFTMADARYKKITARMLLNHSAGLRGDDYVNDAIIAGDNTTAGCQNFLRTLASQSLNADPGAFSVYCNSCFTLSEKLVERISGQSFTQYITRSFSAPLGMTHTSTPENGPGNNIALHRPDNQSRSLPWIHYNVIASGGVNSTAEDMAKFARLFMHDNAGILPADALTQMQAAEYRRGLWPAEADDSGNYGLGWDSVRLYPFNDLRIQALAKGGDISAHHASLVVLPQQNMAAVVLSAGGDSVTNQLFATKLLLQTLALQGAGSTTVREKSFPMLAGVIMPQHLAAYAGDYAHSDGRLTVEITQSGALTVLTPTVEAQSFQYAGNAGFVSTDRQARIEFVEAANGRTYLWVRRYASHPFLGQTASSEFQAEKLQPNPLDDSTKALWAKRQGVRYYPIKYAYNSEAYLDTPVPEEVLLSQSPAGYWGSRRILDGYSASSAVQIPGQAGRETQIATFEWRDGVEYLHVNDNVFISQQAIAALQAGPQQLQLAPTGFAHWVALTPATAGQRIRITVPEKSAFAVYDDAGKPLHYSLIDTEDSLTLPTQGAMVFMGEPAATFTITPLTP